MFERQQSTTSYPIPFFLSSSTDHVTGVTGQATNLTTNATISKNGGSFAAAAGSVSELANGWYSWAGNATDRNTLGGLAFHSTATGADPVDFKVSIVPYDPFGIRVNVGTGTNQLNVSGGRADSNVTYFNSRPGIFYDDGATCTPKVCSAYDASGNAIQYYVNGGDQAFVIPMTAAGLAYATQASVDAVDDYVDTEVAAIKAKTDLIPAGGFPTNFPSMALSVAGAVTVGTNNDKTGYALTQSFPANFASLGINASGHLSRVTLTDTVTTYTGDTPQTGDAYARLGAPAGASVSADIAAVNAKTTNIPSDPASETNATSNKAAVLAAIPSAATNASTLLGTTNGSATVAVQLQHLDADVSSAGGSSGSGTGAYTHTVTVDDGTNPLQNAIVRYTEGANSYTATTNASGIAVFALDAATYSVAITKPGYTFTPTTQAVSGTGSKTWSMTAFVASPASNGSIVGVLQSYTATGAEDTSGVEYTFENLSGTGGGGGGYSNSTQTVTTDSDGVVQVNLPKGVKARGRRGVGAWVEFAVPSTGSSFNLPDLLGKVS